MGNTITAGDLYLAFRSLELTYGHFCDVVAGALNTVITPDQEFSVDDDTYNGILGILNPPDRDPNPCDRPPFCQITAIVFAHAVLMKRAGNHFFAGTCFSINVYRHLRFGSSIHGIQHAS